MNQVILSEKQRLDILFVRLKSFLGDEEAAAHWSRYLCVLLSGFIENAMRILLSEYAKARSHPNISHFVSHSISGLTNLKEERMQQILGSFSDAWRTDFAQMISDEQKDALDSVIANRHNIVHGRSVGVSPVSIQTYYARVLEVLDLIENKCLTK